MKWRMGQPGAINDWKYGRNTYGGACTWLSISKEWLWHAWTQNATSHAERTYKTLKAAQRAVERWLEKHG